MRKTKMRGLFKEERGLIVVYQKRYRLQLSTYFLWNKNGLNAHAEHCALWIARHLSSRCMCMDRRCIFVKHMIYVCNNKCLSSSKIKQLSTPIKRYLLRSYNQMRRYLLQASQYIESVSKYTTMTTDHRRKINWVDRSNQWATIK